MKALLINFVLLSHLLACKGQSVKCEYPFRMEIETGRHQIFSFKKDTIYILDYKALDFSFLKVRLSDCEGEVKVEGMVKNGAKVLSGIYVVDSQISSDTVRVIDPFTFDELKEIYEYKMLLKDGMWSYWDVDGTLIRTEHWNEGNLLKTE